MPARVSGVGAFALSELGRVPGIRPDDRGSGPAEPVSDLALNAALAAERNDLAAEVQRLRAERERMGDLQKRVMELLGCTSPDTIIHDLRNLLNERELYRSLADLDV